MLKKTVLTFAFLTILTTFYGFNAKFSTPVMDDMLNEEADFGNSLLSDGDYVISAYDNIIRNISEKEGHDWRLMSAIAYHESRFTPDITSRSGAKGLMQIMPSVARQFDVPAGDMANPETNIWLANKLMSKIKSTLRFPAGTSDKDRMSIILACYNSGIGHVNDARRLARVNGEDPNSWEVVARYLQLKAQPEYYENEVVKCGRFTGSRQTLAYVNDVIGRYDKYCRVAVLFFPPGVTYACVLNRRGITIGSPASVFCSERGGGEGVGTAASDWDCGGGLETAVGGSGAELGPECP